VLQNHISSSYQPCPPPPAIKIVTNFVFMYSDAEFIYLWWQKLLSEIHILLTFFQLLSFSWADNGSICTSSVTCLEYQTGLWSRYWIFSSFTYHATSRDIDSFTLAEAETRLCCILFVIFPTLILYLFKFLWGQWLLLFAILKCRRMDNITVIHVRMSMFVR